MRKSICLLAAVMILFANATVAYGAVSYEPVLTYMPGSDDPYFGSIDEFTEGLMATEFDGKAFYIAENGLIAISYEKLLEAVEYKFENLALGRYNKGLAVVSEDIPLENNRRKYIPFCVIDIEGNVVSKVEDPDNFDWSAYSSKNSSPFYPKVRSYSDIYGSLTGMFRIEADLYPVKSSYNEKQGYIDKNGDVAIDCKFDQAFPFYNGYALTHIGGVYKFIDKEGNYVSDLEWRTGYMSVNTDRLDLMVEFDDGVNKRSGVRLIKIEMAEVVDGVINRPVKLYVNNFIVNLSTPAEMTDNRVFVDITSIFGALKIPYSMKENVLISNYNGNHLSHVIGSSVFTINGAQLDYTSCSYITGQNTFIPISAVGKLLNAKVSWYGESRLVTIDY